MPKSHLFQIERLQDRDNCGQSGLRKANKRTMVGSTEMWCTEYVEILQVWNFSFFFAKRNLNIFMTDGRIQTNVRAGE